MLSCRHIHLPIGSAELRGEKVALGWPYLRVVPLHLELVINARGNGATGWRISLNRIDCMVRRLRVIDRATIVWSSCLREQVVLV